MALHRHKRFDPVAIAIESNSTPAEFPRSIQLKTSEVRNGEDVRPGQSIVIPPLRIRVTMINDRGDIHGEIQGSASGDAESNRTKEGPRQIMPSP